MIFETTPEQARSIANRMFDPFEMASALRSLADQVDALTDERDEWKETVSRWLVQNGRGGWIDDLRNSKQALTAERDESDAVRDKLALLLAGVAIALKGPELPLHRHSYHDLVHCAEVAMLEIDFLKCIRSDAEYQRDAALALAADRKDDTELYRWAVANVPAFEDAMQMARSAS